MNKVCLTGRLTKDLELKYNQNNRAMVNFNLAVTRNFKNQNGVYEADFIKCVTYGKTAELLSEYIKKGDTIGITGRIQTYNYKDNNDKTVYVTEVVVDTIDFLHSSSDNTKAEEKPQDEPKKGISDDVFADFGNSIEIDDNEIAF